MNARYVVEVYFRNGRMMERFFNIIDKAMSFEFSMNMKHDVLEANVLCNETGAVLS